MLQTWVIAGGVLGAVESVTVSEKLCGEPGWKRGKKGFVRRTLSPVSISFCCDKLTSFIVELGEDVRVGLG